MYFFTIEYVQKCITLNEINARVQKTRVDDSRRRENVAPRRDSDSLGPRRDFRRDSAGLDPRPPVDSLPLRGSSGPSSLSSCSSQRSVTLSSDSSSSPLYKTSEIIDIDDKVSSKSVKTLKWLVLLPACHALPENGVP